jgi:hypothetical protein
VYLCNPFIVRLRIFNFLQCTANKEIKILNKPSNTPPNASPLSRLMKKGQSKTGYKSTSGNLLMQMSENDHKRIAKLIANWLERDK